MKRLGSERLNNLPKFTQFLSGKNWYSCLGLTETKAHILYLATRLLKTSALAVMEDFYQISFQLLFLQMDCLKLNHVRENP